MSTTQKTTTILLGGLILLLVGGTASLGQPSANPDSSLSALIEESWANHPDLAAMREMINEERGRQRMEGAWMNPELRVGLMNLPSDGTLWTEPMTMLQVGLMQRIPWPGKLKASVHAAKARVEATSANEAGAKDDMAQMVAMSYYDLAASREIRGVLIEGSTLAEDMTSAARLMVGSGMGTVSDVLQAELEEKDWSLKRTSNRGDIRRKEATLAYALGRPGTDNLAANLPSDLPVLENLDDLLTGPVIESSPEVRSAFATRSAAGFTLDRAKKEWYSDPSLMLAYGYRGNLKTNGTDPMTGLASSGTVPQSDMITLEVSFPIPVFGKGNQGARIDEMTAMNRKLENDAEKAKLKKSEEVRTLYARWDEAQKSHQIVAEEVVPTAKAGWDAAMIDYRNGKADFMTLSQARMKLLMAEMDEVMYRAESWAIRAQLHAALGLSIAGEEKGQNHE